MKMFVMEEVLTDYTDGMVCVLASTEEEAWEMLKEKDVVAYDLLVDRGSEFKIVDSPEAFVIWGAG